MNEYKAFVANLPRGGHGVDVHCHDVGLEDPSTVATDALVSIGQAPKAQEDTSASSDAEVKREVATTYEEWIKAEQTSRNSKW
jgi:hypothetical protein